MVENGKILTWVFPQRPSWVTFLLKGHFTPPLSDVLAVRSILPRLSAEGAQRGVDTSPKVYPPIAQCADSEVRNAIERTPYIVVLKFHVFILISKSFNFRSPLDRILRYLTKTWFYTLNFKKNSCWWLSIAYWVIENDSVSDTKEHIFVGPLELKILSSLKQMTLTKYNWMPLLFGTH